MLNQNIIGRMGYYLEFKKVTNLGVISVKGNHLYFHQ